MPQFLALSLALLLWYLHWIPHHPWVEVGKDPWAMTLQMSQSKASLEGSSYFCLLSGSHQVVHSRLSSGGAQGNNWGARNRAQVGRM